MDHETPKSKFIIIYLIAVIAWGVFYVALAQRSPSWQDSGEFQWRILSSDYLSAAGLARSHPLYIFAGRLILSIFGNDNFCWAINAFSGIGLAFAVGNLIWLGWIITGKTIPGILCSTIFALAHCPWWLGEVAEVYTWQIAFFIAEMAVLMLLWKTPKVWAICILGLLAGLDLSIHNLALLSYPVYFAVAVMLVYKRKLPWWSLVCGFASWCIGASLWLGLIAWLYNQTGDLMYAIHSGFVGEFGNIILTTSVKHYMLKLNLIFISLNFINIILPLSIIGFIIIWKRQTRQTALILSMIAILHIIFFIRYPVPDKFTFILPSFVMITVFSIFGVNYLIAISPKWRNIIVAACIASALLQPLGYILTIKAARKFAPAQVAQRRPYRDEAEYWTLPWKHNERSAVKYSVEQLKKFPPETVCEMQDNDSALYPLLVTQYIYEMRQDVTFINDKLPGGKIRKYIYGRQK